jgi:hypothetical protein
MPPFVSRGDAPRQGEPDDDTIEFLVNGFVHAVLGNAGRREFIRLDPQYQNLVVERAIDRMHDLVPDARRDEVARAVKFDFARLFGFPIEGRA